MRVSVVSTQSCLSLNHELCSGSRQGEGRPGSSYESGSRTQTKAEARAGEVGGGGARAAAGRGRCSTLISSSTTGGQLSHWHRYSCRDTATATATAVAAATTKGGNSGGRRKEKRGNSERRQQ